MELVLRPKEDPYWKHEGWVHWSLKLWEGGWINPFEGLKSHKGRLSTKGLGHWKDLELRRGCPHFAGGRTPLTGG